MFVNLVYTLFTRFGSDKHNHFDVILLRNVAEVLLIVFEGKVGNDDTVDSTFGTLPAEVIEAELYNRVEVSH